MCHAKLLRTTLAAALMLVAVFGAAVAGPFEDAVAARNSGDYATAQRLFRALADNGNADAQSFLGVMYEKGWGVRQDYAEALKLYRKAADQGSGLGRLQQYILANDAEALMWFRRAAGLGNAFAQGALGYMYEDGDTTPGSGVQQDYAEALKWYHKAAEQGDTYAQNRLGLMYKNGQGVPKDYVNAYMWFNLSASQGNKDAAKYQDQTAHMMTPEQIAEAQKLNS